MKKVLLITHHEISNLGIISKILTKKYLITSIYYKNINIHNSNDLLGFSAYIFFGGKMSANSSSKTIYTEFSFIFVAYFSFDHVQSRVDKFLFSENIQVSKSISAIKEGGLFGVGLGEGQLKYSIPESHNDFIFAILIEEFGLIFGLFIVFLYPAFFIIAKYSYSGTSNLFIENTTFCLCFILCIQAFINIGSSINLIPPTGMTLPFISYGGSSMLSYAFIFGTVINFLKNEEGPSNNTS